MRSLSKILAVALLSSLIGSCVAPPTRTFDLTYSDEEYGKYKGKGDSVVFGQAFLRQQGGGVVLCAGEPVVLFPRTPSFESAINLARQRVQPIPSTNDPRFQMVARKALCDAQGNFRFVDIPRARWYVYSRVQWKIGDYYQGGDLIGEIDTSSGGEVQILLTDINRI